MVHNPQRHLENCFDLKISGKSLSFTQKSGKTPCYSGKYIQSIFKVHISQQLLFGMLHCRFGKNIPEKFNFCGIEYETQTTV